MGSYGRVRPSLCAGKGRLRGRSDQRGQYRKAADADAGFWQPCSSSAQLCAVAETAQKMGRTRARFEAAGGAFGGKHAATRCGWTSSAACMLATQNYGLSEVIGRHIGGMRVPVGPAFQ